MPQATTSAPRFRAKSFDYLTSVEWEHGRSGCLRSSGKKTVRVSSPPEFGGEKGVWSPEDLFVASVEICLMATFMAFAQRQGLLITAYESHAEGRLEFKDGKYVFTRIVLKPKIIVSCSSETGAADELIKKAHDTCLISNSITSELVLEAEIDCMEYSDSAGP